MTDEQWEDTNGRTVQVFLDGRAITVPDERGQVVTDDTFLLVFHAHPENRVVTLPGAPWGRSWRHVMDTEHGFSTRGETFAAGAQVPVLARSLWLFRQES